MSGFLLDTNVISELVKPKPQRRVTAWVEATDEGMLHLSVLTLGEIRKGIGRLPESSRRRALEAWLERDLRSRFAGRILPVDDAVADSWGSISARAEANRTPVPVIDGLLAATAIQNDLILVTRNVRHLTPTGVRVLNPWED